MKKFLITASILMASVTSAFAQVPAANKLPAPLQLAVQGGMKVERQFDAEGGLTGWVLSQGVGKYMIAYTPPGGEVLMAGMLRNAKGEDLSKTYMAKYAPTPDYSKYWSRLEKMETINTGAQGSAVKSVIYAFMDPNCIYCHFAWKALTYYEAAGLQVRWIPVGILGGDSAAKAAALMMAKDPGAAWASHGKTWSTKVPGSGVKPVASIPANVKKILDANGSFMVELGMSGTPGMLYKDASGTVKKLEGMPNLSDLPGITGIPEQEITDPELQRFRR